MIRLIFTQLIAHKLFFVYFSFSIASSALGFISTIVLIRLIAPDEYGRIAIFLSILFVVTPIISISAENLIAINKSKLSDNAYDNFRKSYVSLSYVIFIAVQIVFFAFYTAREQLGGNDALYLLVPLAALLKYLISLASIEYVMEEKSVHYGLLQFLSTALSLVLTVGFIRLFSAVADWRILALIVSDAVFLIVRYRRRMKLLVEFAIDRQHWVQIKHFGFPLLLSVAPAWALNEADKVIVARNFDLATVGLYASASAIGGFMITFNASLLNATLPKLYASLSDHSKPTTTTVKQFLGKHVLFSVVFSGCFALTYGFFADLILPEKYAAARDIVYWIICFALARSFYAILGATIDYLGMTRQKLNGIIFGAAAAIPSIYVGMLQFGIVGVAAGVGVGYSVLGIALWLSLVERSKGEILQ